MTKVPQLEINVDTVYERYNIKDIHTEEQPILWEYDENQLTMEEYIVKQAKEVGFSTGNYIGTGTPQTIERPRDPKFLIVNGKTASFSIEDNEIIIDGNSDEGMFYNYVLIYN